MKIAASPSIGVQDQTQTVGLVRLALTEFRNYAQVVIETAPGPVVLTGPNGAGKTNLLEAISLLAPGRGLRHARLAEIARQGPGRQNGDSQPWAVAARLLSGGDLVDIGTGLDPEGGERRIVRINGAPAPGPAALAEHLAVAWLTPAMDRLFADAASGRRRFLDRMVLTLYPAHGREVSRYEQAMRERNALLEDAQSDGAWLGAVEARMAEHAVAIAAARRETIAALAGLIARAADSAFPKAELMLAGAVEDLLAAGTRAIDAEEALRRTLADGRARDAAAGRTLAGPHRSDLVVQHGPKGVAAAQCSTGEQKALLVGLVLAHAALVEAQSGRAPLLLLDEIAAHLDAERRAALFDAIAGRRGQSWLSGTDEALFEPLSGRADFRHVEAGEIT